MPAVSQDFFLDPAKRLTEQERALMTAMLADLVGGIADELKAALPGGGGPANDEDGHQLLVELSRSGLLNDERLIALLLRRADEDRIAAAMRSRSRGQPAFLQALVGDSDPSVSAAAMAVILARGGRRDRLGQPRVQFDDLAPDLAAGLTFTIAASLRARLVREVAPGEADRQLAAAAEGNLARRDSRKAIGTLTTGLAAALHDAGRLDDRLLQAAAEEGDICFLAEALARRADISGEDSLDYLLEGGGGRLMLLLRMAGSGRQLAAEILALLGDLIDIDDAGSEIGRFDSIGDEAVEQARLSLRLPAAYHQAVAALEAGNG